MKTDVNLSAYFPPAVCGIIASPIHCRWKKSLIYNFCLCTFILIFKKQNIILQNFKRKHISILCGLDIQRQIKRFIIVSNLVKRFMKTVFWNLSKPYTERQKRSPHMHMDEVDGECTAAGGMLTRQIVWKQVDQQQINV